MTDVKQILVLTLAANGRNAVVRKGDNMHLEGPVFRTYRRIRKKNYSGTMCMDVHLETLSVTILAQIKSTIVDFYILKMYCEQFLSSL